MNIKRAAALAALVAAALPLGAAQAAKIKVTVTNDAPAGGTYITPLWVGFHDGSFDLFSADGSATASAGLELVAELGMTGTLSGEFAAAGRQDATLGGPLAPGESASGVFTLAEDGSNDYLSYAAMVLPSSDFFIGNGDPLGLSIAEILSGGATSKSFTVVNVYDAGTEENDFLFSAGNGLFGPLGLPSSNAPGGTDQSLPVALASGLDFASFLNVGGANVAPLNFSNYASLATIEVSAVPVPAALPLLVGALGALGGALRRRV